MAREIKYIEKSEIEKLISVIDSLRDRLLVKLLYATMCRCNEIRNLKLSDIKFDSNLIKLRAEITKTKEPRTVVIPESIKSEIIIYLKTTHRNHKRGNGYLFISRQSRRLTNTRIRQIVHRYARRAALQQEYNKGSDGRLLFTITPHTLRHSAIIEALNKGIPQTAVMEQSGHKSLQAFQIYSKFSVADRQRLFEEKRFYDLG